MDGPKSQRFRNYSVLKHKGSILDGHDSSICDILLEANLIGKMVPELASELKLDSNVAIGLGLIDAHAGALGVLNSQVLSITIV